MVRSRGGCTNCKRRKRKCDETRPDCQACQRRGIQCEGYSTTLKWTNGIASRGRFAGATIPDMALCGNSGSEPARDARQRGPPPGHVSSSNERPEAEGSVSAKHGSDTESDVPRPPVTNSPASTETASPPGGNNDPKGQLFRKFLHAGLNRLYATESKIWMQDHFTIMADKSKAFFVVCTAIQAYLDGGFSVTAMEHVDHALQTFRAELQDRQRSLDISTMSAGILVCTLCLLQARPWTMYLQLMADLYHLDTNLSTLVPPTGHDFATRHSIEVLCIMDLDTSVVGRISPSMGVWRRLRKLQDTWEGGRMGGVEVVSGLPRSFLDIIADMKHSERRDIETRLWAWPGEMGLHAQCLLWDSWRYAAVLDARRLERVRRRASSEEAVDDGASKRDTTDTSSFPQRELVMCRLMASMYAVFRAVEMPANHHLLVHNGLIYPMVIASLEVSLLGMHPEWKQLLEDVRASFLKKDSFHAMKMLDEVLREAWEKGTDTFDIDHAARTRGVEIAIF